MNIKQQLTEDMKQAMRAKDSLRLNTIRFLMAQIKNVEIDEGELSEDSVQKVIAKQVKQMRDAINDFKSGGREDLVEEEMQKVAVLETYLPQQLSDEELSSLVDQVMADLDSKDMGPIIGEVVKRAAGQVDGGRVSAAVRAKLA